MKTRDVKLVRSSLCCVLSAVLCCWLQLSKFSMKETGLVRAIIVRSCSVFLDLAEATLVLVCWNSSGR